MCQMGGCVKWTWSDSLENSCLPLVSDCEHWTWPHGPKEDLAELAQAVKDPGAPTGKSSRVSVTRHWCKQEREETKSGL